MNMLKNGSMVGVVLGVLWVFALSVGLQAGPFDDAPAKTSSQKATTSVSESGGQPGTSTTADPVG